MNQKIPDSQYYTDMVFKNPYLTDSELELLLEPPVQTGYTAYNGKILDWYSVESLNKITARLNQTKCKKTRAFLLDSRHQLFCEIIKD